MQYQTPQFIDIEDKIFGPLTLKQFIYLGGGGGLSFTAWSILPNFIALFVIAAVVSLSVALAFYKVNNKPFIYLLQASIEYVMHARLYLWKKEQKPTTRSSSEMDEKIDIGFEPPAISESRLKNISWNLDVEEVSKAES